jgi:transcriptional regulator with XRE-family HTH domain
MQNLDGKTMQQSDSTNLSLLMTGRNLNRAQMAKILGVEPWTVGAWLSGKREISAKYKEKVNEYLSLPQTSDLLVAPAVNQLSKQIAQVEDEADAMKVTDALVRIITSASYKLEEFSIRKIDQNLLIGLRKMLGVFDDQSVAHLNQLISAVLTERLFISSVSAEEYAKKCVEIATNDKLNTELYLELDADRLYANYSVSFCGDESLENAKHLDDVSVLRDIQYQLKDEAHATGEIIFRYTDFEVDSINDHWINDEIYSMSYHISIMHPRFKESLRLLMNRCTIVQDLKTIGGL